MVFISLYAVAKDLIDWVMSWAGVGRDLAFKLCDELKKACVKISRRMEPTLC